MRLLFTILVVSLAVACSARPVEEDYYDEEAPAEAPAPPASKAPPRLGLSSRTARGPSPLISSRGAKTTAAPVKPAEPEVVNEPEDIDDEGAIENEETFAVTTEAPKKNLGRGVSVRPFRSNMELLAALKRKRQQEHSSGSVSTHPPSVTTSTPAEVKPNSKGAPSRSNSNNNSSSGRRTFSRPHKATSSAAAAEPEIVDEAEAPAKKPSFPSSSRRFAGSRGKSAAPAPVSEDAEEAEVEEPAPRSAKSFRGGRRV